MKRGDLYVAVWFIAGAAPAAMVVVFVLALAGTLSPAAATLDIAILLVAALSCQAIARFWRPRR